MFSWWWVASDTEVLLLVDQSIQLVCKASRGITWGDLSWLGVLVNWHTCPTGGSEEPNEIHEYVHGSVKVNFWCGLHCDNAVSPFFFSESTISGGIYQHMLENYFFPQTENLERETGNMATFIQDGATPHFCRSVAKPWMKSSPMPGMGGDIQSSGLPEVQILPQGTFLWG